MLKQTVHQQLQQQLTPQQIMLVKLIELPSTELEERIFTELEENPALEIATEREENAQTETDEPAPNEDNAPDDYAPDDDIPDYRLKTNNYSDNSPREDIPFSAGVSFHEYLLEQLGEQTLSERERLLAEYLTGEIDPAGYLRRELEPIAEDLLFQKGIEVSIEELQHALSLIQTLDPAGVGASHLQECLLLQVKRKMKNAEHQAVEKKNAQLSIPIAIGINSDSYRNQFSILNSCFDELSKHHYEKIEKKLNITEEELRNALSEIARLNPKPGSNWDTFYEKNKQQIIPDFLLEQEDGSFRLSLNTGHLPALAVTPSYSKMLNDYRATAQPKNAAQRRAYTFLKERIDTAQGFINAVTQRQTTLLNTMQAIVDFQHEYFLSGLDCNLKPMILKDIADRTGYDISTISRVSNSKYIQTEFGIFPLKHFFSESMQTQDGEEVSSREVKAILTECVEKENKQSPLTDDTLSEILQQKGYLIARRTVAKYREQLGIPVARLRRKIISQAPPKSPQGGTS